MSRFSGPDDAAIRGKIYFSRATRPNNDRWGERCCNDAQQWTTVQRAPRRDAGAYRGSCPRHGYVPSMKESKRNNCISGPGGHCSTVAHARPYLAVLTRFPLRAEAALEPAVPRARKKESRIRVQSHPCVTLVYRLCEDLASSRHARILRRVILLDHICTYAKHGHHTVFLRS